MAIGFSPALEREPELPPLEPGDVMDQPTFHSRYAAMPDTVRAELIGGVVHMPSPLKAKHGRSHSLLNVWLGDYWRATPGTELLDNTTFILGEDSEPQPDASLIISGGQTHENADGYFVGPPEFVAEVASTTESYDLHAKRRDYERWGVCEYLVLVLRQPRVVWYRRDGDRFVELTPGPDGILRSSTFPGLWLDPAAILQRDVSRLQQVLSQGLATREHTEFVERLRSGSHD